MHETTTAPERHHDSHITRKNLFNSMLIGIFLGVLGGIPIGWFIHQVYAKQHAAQVLLCRQQNFGLSEPELQSRCGAPY